MHRMTSFWRPARPAWFIVFGATLAVLQLASAQTRITAPKNKYTPEQDVQIGQEAAAEVLGLPYSTYRRHLAQGVARIVAWLWDREVYGATAEHR